MRKRVLAVAALAPFVAVLAPASPAQADCIEYTQYEMTSTDFNSDGYREVVVYYPPVVSDTNPRDCLSSGPGDVPRVIGTDLVQVG